MKNLLLMVILCLGFSFAANAQGPSNKEFLDGIKNLSSPLISMVKENMDDLADNAKIQLMDIAKDRSNIKSGANIIACHNDLMTWCDANLPEEDVEALRNKPRSLQPQN